MPFDVFETFLLGRDGKARMNRLNPGSTFWGSPVDLGVPCAFDRIFSRVSTRETPFAAGLLIVVCHRYPEREHFPWQSPSIAVLSIHLM
jgi:hypothetical protein